MDFYCFWRPCCCWCPDVSCSCRSSCCCSFTHGAVLAGVSAVAAVPTVADIFFLLLMFPMSDVAFAVASPLFLASLLLLAPCHTVAVPSVDGISAVVIVAAVATSSLLLPYFFFTFVAICNKNQTLISSNYQTIRLLDW
jgi:hypothetical protein